IPIKSIKTTGKTLVTGAAGFIGGRIVETLYLSGERDVRAGIRQWASAARLGRFPVDIVKMDLLNKDEIKQALDGVDKIIHCAYGDSAVTVQGTTNLLEASMEKKIDRFVHLSTSEVYGDVSGQINEDSPLQYSGNEYSRMKIDAEKACWEFHRKGLPIVIIRPSIVYGPFGRNWTVRFAKTFIAGKGAIYEIYGEGKCNLVFIDDLVKGILIAIEHKNAIGQAFNFNGPEVISWNEYFQRFNEKMGLSPLKSINMFKVDMRSALMGPVRILGRFVRDNFMGPAKKIAETSEFVNIMMKRTENKLKTTLSREELKLFNKDTIYSCNKAKKLIKFYPSFSIDEGLNLTVAWLKHNGY
ncbi:NAD-dependent epimerase/dehydratase family protein, partial [bacterium]|nr:NAD-dependent epimerase/dehydratase family protein [bacterium]